MKNGRSLLAAEHVVGQGGIERGHGREAERFESGVGKRGEFGTPGFGAIGFRTGDVEGGSEVGGGKDFRSEIVPAYGCSAACVV